jgi:hypothetical protein
VVTVTVESENVGDIGTYMVKMVNSKIFGDLGNFSNVCAAL